MKLEFVVINVTRVIAVTWVIKMVCGTSSTSTMCMRFISIIGYGITNLTITNPSMFVKKHNNRKITQNAVQAK